MIIISSIAAEDTTLRRRNPLQTFLIRCGGGSKLGVASTLVLMQHEILVIHVTTLVLPESGAVSGENPNEPGFLTNRFPSPVLLELIIAWLNGSSGAFDDDPDHSVEGSVDEEAA